MPIELLIFLAIPVAILLFMRYHFKLKISYKEMAIQFILISSLVTITYVMGISSMSSDTEIYNGYITSKDRIHGTYEDAYDCMCVSDKDGFTTCQTCYETRYTVEWKSTSTIGDIQFDKLDKSSKSVYNALDPIAYKKCVIGEPASLEYPYTNYILAVPDTLFKSTVIDPEFSAKIPTYPSVYGFYKINRVVNVDSTISQSEINKLNLNISNYLKTIGHSKQVNVIVVLTEIDDQNYRFSLEAAWLGGNKNDVIVIIGLDGNKITWVDTITWALNNGNEFFQVNMRDRISKIGIFNADLISNATKTTILEYYDRPTMKSFEHLKDEIEPPTYILILMFIISVFGSIGLSYYFYTTEY